MVNQDNSFVFQDSNGVVGTDKSRLVPPLVRVSNVMSRLFGSDITVPYGMEHPETILMRDTLHLKNQINPLRFEFLVSPPRRLRGFYFQGYGAVIIIEQATTGLQFSMKQIIPPSEDPNPIFYPLTIPQRNLTTFQLEVYAREDSLTYARFVFDDMDMSVMPRPSALGNSLWQHEASKDLTIVTPSQVPIKVHKSVLASQSNFFAGMLFGAFNEATSADVYTAKEGSTGSWNNLVRFVYDRHLENRTTAVLLETLELGYFYDIPHLVTCAWAAVSQPPDKFVLLRCMRVAFKHSDPVIGRKCWIIMKRMLDRAGYGLIRNARWIRAYSALLEEIGSFPSEWSEGDTTEPYSEVSD